MPYQDLRAFLTALKSSGELVDIARPVSPKYDIAKALAKASAVRGSALMFTQTGTDFPLVAGVYGNRRLALMAFEASEKTIHEKVLKGINNPIAPVDFKGKPPCQEVVLTGDAIDVTKLPVPIYSPKDGGPYITAGIVVSEISRPAFPTSETIECRSMGRRSSASSPPPTTASARTSPMPPRWESSSAARW